MYTCTLRICWQGVVLARQAAGAKAGPPMGAFQSAQAGWEWDLTGVKWSSLPVTQATAPTLSLCPLDPQRACIKGLIMTELGM